MVERLNMETLIPKTLSSEGDSWPSYASGEGTAEVFLCPTTQSVAGSCWQHQQRAALALLTLQTKCNNDSGLQEFFRVFTLPMLLWVMEMGNSSTPQPRWKLNFLQSWQARCPQTLLFQTLMSSRAVEQQLPYAFKARHLAAGLMRPLPLTLICIVSGSSSFHPFGASKLLLGLKIA